MYASSIFSAFNCVDYGTPGARMNRLVVDLKIDCDSSAHRHYETYALGMMAIYPLGVPLSIVALFLHKR